MMQVGGDLWQSFSSNLVSKVSLTRAGCSGLCPEILSNCKDGDTTVCLSNLFQRLTTHMDGKRAFLLSQLKFPIFQIGFISSFLPLCASKKSLVATSLYTPTGKLSRAVRSTLLLPFPQTEQTQLTWPLLVRHMSQPLDCLGSPLLTVPVIPRSVFYW